MGSKTALSVKKLNTVDNATPVSGSPFWVKPKTKNDTWKKVLKIFLKWFKMAIFLFMMVIGLWGCFQSMWDPTVATNSSLGNGLEFGFLYGTTGDYRFDLQAAPGAQYNTFSSEWTMVYGPFYAFFVWPACMLVLNFMWVTSNWWGGMNALMAIFLLLIIIRFLSLTVTLKSTFQNERMHEIQGKMAEINAKYKNIKDPAAKQQKQQETMALYSKYNIKPFAAFEQMFLTLPIFLVVYRVVTIVRPMKVSVLFGIWNFALVPTSQIFSNFTDMGWTYIFFLIIVMVAQFLSMKIPQKLAKQRNRGATAVSSKGDKQQRKTRMTQNIFVIVMCVIVAFSATGVGVYWFMNAMFSLAQAYIIHLLILRKRKKDRGVNRQIDNFSFV